LVFELIDSYCKSYSLFVCVVQKALKEKEEHIQQLLVERDLERAEFARMAAHVDEVNFSSVKKHSTLISNAVSMQL